MLTLTEREALRLGYRQVGKALRWRATDGTEYTRCLLGRPSLCIVGLRGEKVYLSPVTRKKA